MVKKSPPIKYINRDFEGIKQDLINYAKAYYPDTYKDFNKSSFGSMLLDLVAYTGDVLSFYSDYQLNETFIDSAVETKNILKIAKQMGFKYPGAASSAGLCAFYVTVPAANGLPNSSAVPVLKRGTTLGSAGGASFILNQDIDFSKADTELVVGAADSSNVPTDFVYKAYGEVVSGKYETEFLTIGEYEKFLKLKLEGENITEITSIIDAEGHEYFEVDYLSQNIVYRAIRNRAGDKEIVPYIMKEMLVPRRFVVEHTADGETYLQFGYGSSEQLKTDDFPEPSAAALQVYGKKYYKDDSFDPNLLMKTDKFGIVPPAGTLTITFRKNDAVDVNVPVGSLSTIATPVLDFSSTDVTSATKGTVLASLEVKNEEPILGQLQPLTVDEIRTRALDAYASQNRAVTKQDYLSLIYRMHSKFGTIKRANIMQDKNSFKRNLNLYVVSEDLAGKLTLATSTLKDNLKVWLNQYRMINDTIDMLDGNIANIGIQFEIVGSLDKSKSETLAIAIDTLKKEFGKPFSFAEPLYISDIYRVLNDLPEVVDTTYVKVRNKFGSDYSTTTYDVEANTTADDRYIIVPEDVVLEIKFPDQDITGVVI